MAGPPWSDNPKESRVYSFQLAAASRSCRPFLHRRFTERLVDRNARGQEIVEGNNPDVRSLGQVSEGFMQEIDERFIRFPGAKVFPPVRDQHGDLIAIQPTNNALQSTAETSLVGQ